ncbi:MAG: hypothetical protein MUC51_03210 [Anaerolineae bacterium]|jgi:hypothetical protein|nr:hypothetical protein [Anaerolineae bacterium]
MKPGPKDIPYHVLITGRELEELKKHTWLMAEAFGLDRRIVAYQGKRPITLYAWDLDCLVDVMTDALVTSTEYPIRSGPAYEALQSLRDRLARLVASR